MEERQTGVSGGQATVTRQSSLAYLPNFLSASRLPIAAAFFVVDELQWRGVLLLVGAMTDALDGWTARRFQAQSRVGVIMDPLFDKLFVLVVLAAFLAGPHLGWLEFLLLIARDLYVGFAYLTAKALSVQLRAAPRPAGKLVTFLQVVTLFVLLLVPESVDVFVIAVAVASLIAIIDYTVIAINETKSNGNDDDRRGSLVIDN